MNETQSFARGEQTTEVHRGTLIRIVRAQSLFAVSISLLIAGTCFIFNFLDNSDDGSQAERWACVAAIVLVLIAVPFGIGDRLLIGYGRTHEAILAGILNGPLILGFVWFGVYAELPGYFMYSVWPLAAVTVNIVTTIWAFRRISIAPGPLLLGVIGIRAWKSNVPLLQTSISAVLISIASPLGYATDRLVLAAVSTVEQVTLYSIVAQIYAPALGVLTAAATPLWGAARDGFFERARRFVFLFGSLFAGALVFISPLYHRFLTGGWDMTITLPLSFATLLLVQAALLPMLMVMNQGADLRFQAKITILFTVVNLCLSVPGAMLFGAVGPVLGSALAAASCQLLPSRLRIRRQSREARRDASAT